MSEGKIREVEQKLVSIEDSYSFDRRELGKLLVVASASLLVVSIYGFYSIDRAYSNVESVESSLESSVGIVESESFNRSLQALRDLGGTGPGRSISAALEGLENSRRNLNTASEVSDQLENERKNLQWITLASILGISAGASMLFI